MIEEKSALGQIPPTIMRLNNGQTIEVNPKKLELLLEKFHCYPTQHRKEIWSYLLQLPNNKDEYNILMGKTQLPQAKKLCQSHKCGNKTLSIVNALIHWHAPLINCDWLPPFIAQLVHQFKNDQQFVLEVAMTFLTNVFREWLPNVPGPPPEVLSRVDAILANHDIKLRNSIGTAFVAWPVYRSCFAEILYHNSWIELMDNIFSRIPQYLEFLVVAWIDINGPMLCLDHSTFHSTRRAVNLQVLLQKAQEIELETHPTLFSHVVFNALSSPQYPLIEASSDAVILRTLQSDHDKLAILQSQLQEERKKADEIEQIKIRKKQTFDSIQQVHQMKENEERAETAKAAALLDSQMKALRLEGRKLRIADERQFIEMWQSEWDIGIDTNVNGTQYQIIDNSNNEETERMIDSDLAKFEALRNLRSEDLLEREARRMIVTNAKHAKSELNAQAHQRALHNEINKLANNPALLTNLSTIKSSKKE